MYCWLPYNIENSFFHPLFVFYNLSYAYQNTIDFTALSIQYPFVFLCYILESHHVIHYFSAAAMLHLATLCFLALLSFSAFPRTTEELMTLVSVSEGNNPDEHFDIQRPFRVDGDGVIYTNVPLDREHRAEYVWRHAVLQRNVIVAKRVGWRRHVISNPEPFCV